MPSLGEPEGKNEQIGLLEGLRHRAKVELREYVELPVAARGITQPGSELVDHLAVNMPAVLLRRKLAEAALRELEQVPRRVDVAVSRAERVVAEESPARASQNLHVSLFVLTYRKPLFSRCGTRVAAKQLPGAHDLRPALSSG